MSKKELAEQVRKLHEKGNSMSAIARALDLSKTKVYRLIHEEEEETSGDDHLEAVPLSPGNKTQYFETQKKVNNNMEEGYVNPELMKLKLTQEHEREMFKLKQGEETIRIQRMEQSQKISEHSQKQQEKENEKIRQGKFYLKQYKRLFQKLNNACQQEDWWKKKYMKQFVDDLSELKEDVENFVIRCHDVEPESLVICQNLDYWVEFMIQIIEEHEEAEEERYEELLEAGNEDEFQKELIDLSLDPSELDKLGEHLLLDDFLLTNTDNKFSEEE